MVLSDVFVSPLKFQYIDKSQKGLIYIFGAILFFFVVYFPVGSYCKHTCKTTYNFIFLCAYIRCMYASVSDVTSINVIVKIYFSIAELKTKNKPSYIGSTLSWAFLLAVNCKRV